MGFNSSPSTFLLIFAILAVHLTLSSSSTVDFVGEYFPARSSCKGSIAECLLAGDEMEMDSESNRRILATAQYISYGAMKKDSVPCSRRGASYYNCRSGAQANPYSRGCSAITRCRS